VRCSVESTVRCSNPIRRRLRRPAGRLRAFTTLLISACLAGGVAACGASSATKHVGEHDHATSGPAQSGPAQSRPAASRPAASSSAAAAAAGPAASGPAAAVTATNALATSLLPRLSDPSGNAIFSPYSIATALAMVDQGAAGATGTQIDRVLGGAASPATLATAARALATALAGATRGHGPHPPTLTGAAAVWLQSGLTAEPQFVERLTDDFAAPPQAAEFATDAGAARQQINAWAADHTGGQIQQLMPPASITPATVLVLADALFLKARWATPFTAALTRLGSFHPLQGAAIQAPFMTLATPTQLSSVTTASYQAVELPYAGSSLSLLAVMPRAGTLDAFEQGLAGGTSGSASGSGSLSSIVAGLTPGLVQVRMPRLHLSLQTSLVGALAALGMPDAFTADADFSGIATGRRLAIQAVEHAARLDVDEAGTVATAATGVSVAPTAILGGPHRTITLDRPFLLFLRDDGTGAILFAARVENPLAG
jgi:serpin B